MKMLVKDSLSIASIFILFIISFLLREPHLTNKVDAADAASLQVLTTLDIWNQSSITDYSFLPVQSYQHDGDLKIHYYQRLNDQKFNNYYVSYPPLCFILPYAIHQIGFPINRLLIVYLNIFLHFIASIYLFFLLKSILKVKSLSFAIISSLLFFIIVPVMIYSYSRMYFAETLGLTLWIAALFHFYKTLYSSRNFKLHLCLFMLFMSLLTYTEWISIFFYIGLAIFLHFSKSFDMIKRKKIILSASIAVAVPLLLFAIQLLSLNSAPEIVRALGIRFFERSGWFGQSNSSDGVSIVQLNSFLSYGKIMFHAIGLIGILMCSIIVVNLASKSRRIAKLSSDNLFILLLVILPILLHNIFFFNANTLHYHLQIKWIFLISLSWAIYSKNIFFKPIWNIIIQCFVMIFVFIFSFTSPVFKAQENPFLDKIAQDVVENVSTRSSIFANIASTPPMPLNMAYLSYQTKRNFALASDTIEAKNISKSLNISDFIFIVGNQKADNYSILRCNTTE